MDREKLWQARLKAVHWSNLVGPAAFAAAATTASHLRNPISARNLTQPKRFDSHKSYKPQKIDNNGLWLISDSFVTLTINSVRSTLGKTTSSDLYLRTQPIFRDICPP